MGINPNSEIQKNENNIIIYNKIIIMSDIVAKNIARLKNLSPIK